MEEEILDQSDHENIDVDNLLNFISNIANEFCSENNKTFLDKINKGGFKPGELILFASSKTEKYNFKPINPFNNLMSIVKTLKLKNSTEIVHRSIINFVLKKYNLSTNDIAKHFTEDLIKKLDNNVDDSQTLDFPDNHVWFIGMAINKGWICQGIFKDKITAIANCRYDEFIATAKIGERLPENVEDIECLYWPHKQTKDEALEILKMMNQK